MLIVTNMENDIIKLTKRLIEIPSFVSKNDDEGLFCEFMYKYLKTNFPTLAINKQYVGKTRFNILVNPQKNPKILFLGHLDTVQPKFGWKTNPLKLTVKNDKLYGLGTADMKGSVVSLLLTLEELNKTTDLSKIMICLYVDEEYDFYGMKRLTKDFESMPKLTVSLDGDLDVSSGCRGLIEINCTFLGKSAHASKPFLGVNVIRETNKLIDDLEKFVQKFEDRYLGISTLNIAYIRAGTITKDNNNILWQREGNVIPDYADVTIEARTASKKLDAYTLINQIKQLIKKYKLGLQDIKIRQDLLPWPVAYSSKEFEIIKNAYKKSGLSFRKSDRKFSGYIDAAMLSEKINLPIFIIGAGGENAHGANENTSIENIEKAKEIYKSIICDMIGERL